MNLQKEINKLDRMQKVELVNTVLSSIDNDSNVDFESEWLEKANERLNNLDETELITLNTFI